MSTLSTIHVVYRIAGLLLLVFALLLLLGCAGTERITEKHLERAQTALMPLKQQLIAELSNAMADGPVHAIEVCQIRAPEIAANLSRGETAMGRTSHRLRNPHNAPAPWMQPLLDSYLADSATGEPRAVLLGDGRFGYVEPIRVKPLCLGCHGSDLDPAVNSILEERYPQDDARGFAIDDFRGLFWVTMPLREVESEQG